MKVSRTRIAVVVVAFLCLISSLAYTTYRLQRVTNRAARVETMLVDKCVRFKLESYIEAHQAVSRPQLFESAD